MSPELSEHPEFTYQAKWTVLIAGFILLAATGVSFASLADSNRTGLLVSGLAHLDREQASTLYLLLSAACFAMVAAACMAIVTRVAGTHKLILTGDGLYAPRRVWSHELSFIRYADIQSISRYSIRNHEFVTIIHARGRQTINAAKLPSPADFAEFCHALELRVQEHRPDALAGPAHA